MSVYALALIALNGFTLGLASTLHCAGMCGAISCGLLLADERGSARRPYVSFVLTQSGRIVSYAIAGAVIGAVGAPAVAWLDREVAFRLLQWAAAAALIWIGLSTAGLVPSINVIDRGFTGIANRVARAGSSVQAHPFAPFVSGLAWGMMPCAMVYTALFAALLTGSAVGGIATMAAFGLGTLPGLLAAGLGFRRLAQVRSSARARLAAGLAIATFGTATVLFTHPHSPYFCLPAQAAATSDDNASLRAPEPVDRRQTQVGTLRLGSADEHELQRR